MSETPLAKERAGGPITTSLFDLFKIGPGPSSSHTIGPMRAAGRFRRQVLSRAAAWRERALRLEAILYGSLSATGRGHGTSQAVLAGLLGHEPETVDPDWLRQIWNAPDASYALGWGPHLATFRAEDIQYGPVSHPFPFSNTLDFALWGEDRLLFGERYYSTGGGFIRWEGWTPPELGQPVHPYRTMEELGRVAGARRMPLPDLVLENECAITGATPQAVWERLEKMIRTMEESVERGLHEDGWLPGPIHLRRKAPVLFRSAQGGAVGDPSLVRLNAYCMAASEENAAGQRVVTAPTSGACGVLPGLVHWLREDRNLTEDKIREGMLAAGAVGFLIKHNASISGAEVGCQGEVGAASAMGAALLAQAHGASLEVVANAAEIALEHHLGMTCDPVGGLVQIPCIERNAMGAAKAWNAFLLAQAGDPSCQKVSLDLVIATMLRTGLDMSSRYKETSQGGLALSLTHC